MSGHAIIAIVFGLSVVLPVAIIVVGTRVSKSRERRRSALVAGLRVQLARGNYGVALATLRNDRSSVVELLTTQGRTLIRCLREMYAFRDGLTEDDRARLGRGLEAIAAKIREYRITWLRLCGVGDRFDGELALYGDERRTFSEKKFVLLRQLPQVEGELGALWGESTELRSGRGWGRIPDYSGLPELTELFTTDCGNCSNVKCIYAVDSQKLEEGDWVLEDRWFCCAPQGTWTAREATCEAFHGYWNERT